MDQELQQDRQSSARMNGNGKVHDGRATRLMKDIGAKKWAPMPEEQYLAWQDKTEALGVRFWALVCSKTISLQHNSPYCTDSEGNELHIENLAAILDADEANVYREFRHGIRRGRYRKGTPKEGPRRVYICGNVEELREPETGEETANTTVCTDSWPPHILMKLKASVPTSLHNTVESWPAEKRRKFWSDRAWRLEVRETTLAELVSAGRAICDQDDDRSFREWGLEPKRQEHERNGVPPEFIQARAERMKSILPHVEVFVQTVVEFVQTAKEPLYKPLDDSAVTPLSLLSSDLTRHPLDVRPSGQPKASPAPAGAHHSNDGERRKLVPAAELPVLAGEEKEAEDLLWEEIPRMQRSYPHTDFSSETVSRKNKGDRVTIRKVLWNVGAPNVLEFVKHVDRKFRGLDKNALGKLPSREPGSPHGPRSLGLILYWSQLYGQSLTEAARVVAAGAAEHREKEIRCCLEILADPKEPAAIKAATRELLQSYGVDPSRPGKDGEAAGAHA